MVVRLVGVKSSHENANKSVDILVSWFSLKQGYDTVKKRSCGVNMISEP